MKITIEIPKSLEQDAIDAFSYNDQKFSESEMTKKEWMLYLVNRYVRDVAEDYIVNIKPLEQLRQAQKDIKQQIRRDSEVDKITVLEQKDGESKI